MSTDLLFVINEKHVDFEELKRQGFDLLKALKKQKWEGYFDMLNEPIYPNLVRDFWVNASLGQYGQDASEIQSYVNGFPITITPSLIVKEIRSEEKGFCVEYYRTDDVFSSLRLQIYANHKKLSSPATLLPIAKVWHQIIVSNLHPKRERTEMIVTSRGEMSILIPYERVLSELFSQEMIVMRIKMAGGALEVERSQKFEYVK